MHTATACTIEEKKTFIKNIYFLKKSFKNVVPTNGFDCKIKYFSSLKNPKNHNERKTAS